MDIRHLPENLINQIAAGEVIERPFSVVRELVENSIDAGATQITVSVRDGGKSHIKIVDNGIGMNRENLIRSVDRHATSKLPEDDLVYIASLGFRGEALPSIGSVARLSLTSRTQNNSEGWQLTVEGGKKSDPIPAAHPVGTTVEVRDLFFATPARLKFLKSSQSENIAIKDVLVRLAMAYPEIGFTFNQDNISRFSVPPITQGHFLNARIDRIAALLGRDFKENTMPLESRRDDGFSLFGFASLPTFHKATAQNQYLFVNGRPVQDKTLKGALRGAYNDVMDHNRCPVAILFVEAPPEDVDMNVHPAKSEVRFRDSGIVRGMIIGTIKNTLMEHGHQSAPSVSQSALGAFEKPDISPIHSGTRLHQSTTARPGGFYDSSRTQTALHSFAPAARTENQVDGTAQENSALSEHPLGAAKAQLFKNYIIAQAEDGLVIIDQHAAHERLTYERIKNDLHQSGVARQGMLIPEIVDLDEASISALMDNVEDLKKLGLVIASFGKGSVSVEEVPAMLGNRVDWQSLVRDIAETLQDIDNTQNLLQDHLWALCSRMSCHGSVRSGRILNADEMNNLLRAMENEALSGQCNHGRPTYVKLSLQEIEKLFGRK